MLYKITISSGGLRIVIKTIILLNIFFLIGTWVINSPILPKQSYWSHIFFQFDLASENNLAAWYSSMLLFLSTIMSVICFAIDRQRFEGKFNQYLNFGWLLFAMIFATLSFDELGSIHETIGDSLLFKDAGKDILGNQSSGWIIFMGLVALVSLFMLLFSILRLRFSRWAVFFFLLGLLFYLTNPFQENFEIESHQSVVDPSTWSRPVVFTLIEEGSEIFGSLFFIIGVSLYALRSMKLLRIKSPKVQILEFKESVISRFILFTICLSALLLIVVKLVFGNVIGQAQVGVPKNWFTAIMALTVAVYCFNTLVNFSLKKKQLKNTFWLTGILGIVFSIFYGTNLYAYEVTASSGGLFRKEIIDIILLAITFICTALLYHTGKNSLVRIGALIWFALICIGLSTKPIISCELIFSGFCFIFYTLLVYTFKSFDAGLISTRISKNAAHK